MSALANIDEAGALIAKAKNLDEAFTLKALFKVAEIEARRKGLTDVEQKTIEYKFWTIDKIGELLELMKQNGERADGRAESWSNKKRTPTSAKTLSDLGITKNESSRYQGFHRLSQSKKLEIIQLAKDRTERVRQQTIKETLDGLRPIEPVPVPEEVSVKIYNRDLVDCPVKTHSIDFILTDPPWNMKLYEKEWVKLGSTAKRVLKPGSRLISYCGHWYMLDSANTLARYLRYTSVLCIVLKGNKQLAIDGYFTEWTPALVFVNEPYRTHTPCTDLFDNDAPEKKYHEWGQGVTAAEQIIRFHTRPGDLLFDPFGGGGSFIDAAIRQKRNIIACERDPKVYRMLKKRFPGACVD